MYTNFVLIKNVGYESGYNRCHLFCLCFRAVKQYFLVTLKGTSRLFQQYSITFSTTQSISISQPKDSCIHCISRLYTEKCLFCLDEGTVHKWNGLYSLTDVGRKSFLHLSITAPTIQQCLNTLLNLVFEKINKCKVKTVCSDEAFYTNTVCTLDCVFNFTTLYSFHGKNSNFNFVYSNVSN